MLLLAKFCCFCLKKHKTLTHLNNKNCKNVDLINKLTFCIKSDLNSFEVPTFICPKCCTKLKKAYEFKKKSLENWNRFEDYVRTLKQTNLNFKTNNEFKEVQTSDIKLENPEFNDKINLDECFIIGNSIEPYSVNGNEGERASEEIFECVVIKKEIEQLTNENVEFAPAEVTSLSTVEDIVEESVPTIPDDCHVNRRQIYCCPTCQKTFDKETKLNYHTLIHIKNDCKNYQCLRCGKKFDSKGKLCLHTIIHSNRCRIEPETSPSKCTVCRSYVDSFELHSMQPRYNECRHCGETFCSKYFLKKHVELHHQEKLDHVNSYTCYKCQERFSSKFDWNRHVLTHSDDDVRFTTTCLEEPHHEDLPLEVLINEF